MNAVKTGDAMTTVMLAATAVVVLLGLLLSQLIGWSISKSLNKLKTELNTLAEKGGDLTQEKKKAGTK